jgi:hypothetical protein
MLIDRASTAALSAPYLPAPYWFIELFKWLGFTLHAVPMNLWYAGLLVALWLHWRGDPHARRFAERLLQQMPIIVALGVNLGVVPLLFLQLAYFRVFYPATILMAWFWMAIIGLLIPAYYGVYAYAWQIRNGAAGIARWRIVAGWCAAVFFIIIGFLFANGLSLMDHVERWPELWQRHGTAGAALGTALNVGDPTLWPRWFLMFGLALGTTAVWLLVDVFLLAGRSADEAYRRWAISFARNLYTLGMIWTTAAGTWYLATWSPKLQEKMFQWPLAPLTVLTAIAMGLPWLLMRSVDGRSQQRTTVAVVALCQFGVLGINALSRQVVQNLNLRLGSFLDVSSQPVDVQWGPLAMFLIVFAIGLAVIGWMLAQVAKCGDH